MMQINNPRDLFVHELQLIYDTEHKIRELLQEASGKANDKDLAQMLRNQAKETAQEINKLDQCFAELGEQPQRMPCAGIDGIMQDYQTIAKQHPSPDVYDMAVVSTGMKIDHYEIGVYRDLVDRAVLMDQSRVAQILQSILYEEEESASRLERASHEMSQRTLAAV